MKLSTVAQTTTIHSLSSLGVATQKLLLQKKLTNKQAHNISEWVILFSIINNSIPDKIQQHVVDICAKVIEHSDFSKSILPTIEHIVNNLTGDMDTIAKINKFFTTAYKKTTRVDALLRIMNLTSAILHKEDEAEFKRYIMKYF